MNRPQKAAAVLLITIVTALALCWCALGLAIILHHPDYGSWTNFPLNSHPGKPPARDEDGFCAIMLFLTSHTLQAYITVLFFLVIIPMAAIAIRDGNGEQAKAVCVLMAFMAGFYMLLASGVMPLESLGFLWVFWLLLAAFIFKNIAEFYLSIAIHHMLRMLTVANLSLFALMWLFLTAISFNGDGLNNDCVRSWMVR